MPNHTSDADALDEQQWKGPFSFIQAADTQFGLIDGWNGVKFEEQTWDKEIALTLKAIKIANEMQPRPKFFVVCGDLVDAFPWTERSDLQIADFKRCFQGLNSSIPLVCVCGNHDIGDSPTAETVAKYRRNFGMDYFSFWKGGVIFIVLNSQFYKDCSKVQDEYDKQEKWLDETLAAAQDQGCKHVVVFQHIPWFLKDLEEDDDPYFNITKEVRKRMIDKFLKARVQYIFCGHYHRNAGGVTGNLEVIVTSAVGCQLGNEKSGMRIVRVFEDKLDHKYYDFDNCPTAIALDEKQALP